MKKSSRADPDSIKASLRQALITCRLVYVSIASVYLKMTLNVIKLNITNRCYVLQNNIIRLVYKN